MHQHTYAIVITMNYEWTTIFLQIKIVKSSYFEVRGFKTKKFNIQDLTTHVHMIKCDKNHSLNYMYFKNKISITMFKIVVPL